MKLSQTWTNHIESAPKHSSALRPMWSTLLSQNRRAFRKLHLIRRCKFPQLKWWHDRWHNSCVSHRSHSIIFYGSSLISYHIWQKWILSPRPVHLVFGDCHAWGCTLAKESSIDIPWKCTRSTSQSPSRHPKIIGEFVLKKTPCRKALRDFGGFFDRGRNEQNKKRWQRFEAGTRTPSYCMHSTSRGCHEIHDDFSSRRLNTRPTWGDLFTYITIGDIHKLPSLNGVLYGHMAISGQLKYPLSLELSVGSSSLACCWNCTNPTMEQPADQRTSSCDTSRNPDIQSQQNGLSLC